MNQKTLSIVSYITIIGWLISYFSSNNEKRSSLLKFHLKQSLGLTIVSFVISIVVSIVVSIIPAIAILSKIISILIFVLMILGILNANKEVEKEIPIIGGSFRNAFNFIN